MSEVDDEKKVSPPQDLPLNLDLYNYDCTEAQSCPYVLTSPRSLEACSRIGVKPVDLLHKTLEEFSGELESGIAVDEVCRLYDEYETKRRHILKKCQAERDFIMWRSTSHTRSHSLSPCRKKNLINAKDSVHTCASVHSEDLFARKSDDLLLSVSQEHDSVIARRSRSESSRNRNPRPTSWSTPSSPYYRGSSNIYVRITSPVVCAKLQSFPKNKMRLPPKDMKILGVLLQKYEKSEEEEHLKAKALRMWDREREEREKIKEKADMERWKTLALRQQRSSSEERFKVEKEDTATNQCCSRLLPSPRSEKEELASKQNLMKHRSFKVPKNQERKSSERLSRYDAEQKMKAIRLREAKVEQRRQEILNKRDDDLRRSAEELREKIKQVKENQQDLDKALEEWHEQILGYQYSSNIRASERVAEICEQKRLKAKQDRLNREAEHKKKKERLEANEYARLQEMMEKLRSKDERSKAFVEEKNSTIEQSRQLAVAASDLRDLVRQKLDKGLFGKRSQQAALESRLLRVQSRCPRKSESLDEL